MSIGKTRDYFSPDNFMNILINCISIAMLGDPNSHTLRSFTILIYWFRLLGFFRCAETVGMVLMPVQKSTNNIKPALFVTGVFFLALTEAFYVFAEDSSLSDNWFD